MRQAIYDTLSADNTLMAILSGGLYHEIMEISRQNTPAAFDANREIQPCALLKFTTSSPEGPFDYSAQLFFSLYFYQRVGVAQLEAALDRVYELLHQQKVTPASGGCWLILHTNDVLDQEDTALQCSLALSRYMAVINRR